MNRSAHLDATACDEPDVVLDLSDAAITVPTAKRRESSRVLLHDMNLRVRAGQSLAITGRSGSGKSTLLYGLGLLLPFERGAYRVNGLGTGSLSRAKAARVRGASFGFVFQDAALIGELDAAQNVMLPLGYRGDYSKGETRSLAAAALELVGLGGFERRAVRSLSGGEQQRVAIARAIVHRPRAILADEPTGALDPVTSSEVVGVLTQCAERTNAALVVVTHDPPVAAEMQRHIGIVDGELRELRRGADA